MENLIQRSTESGPLFPKSGHFFQFSKRAGAPQVAHMFECG